MDNEYRLDEIPDLTPYPLIKHSEQSGTWEDGTGSNVGGVVRVVIRERLRVHTMGSTKQPWKYEAAATTHSLNNALQEQRHLVFVSVMEQGVLKSYILRGTSFLSHGLVSIPIPTWVTPETSELQISYYEYIGRTGLLSDVVSGEVGSGVVLAEDFTGHSHGTHKGHTLGQHIGDVVGNVQGFVSNLQNHNVLENHTLTGNFQGHCTGTFNGDVSGSFEGILNANNGYLHNMYNVSIGPDAAESGLLVVEGEREHLVLSNSITQGKAVIQINNAGALEFQTNRDITFTNNINIPSITVSERLVIKDDMRCRALQCAGIDNTFAGIVQTGLLHGVGSITSEGYISVSGEVNITSTMSVGGSIAVSDWLSVAGVLTVQNEISTSGKIIVQQDISAGSAATISSGLSVGGAATISSALSVGSAATLSSALSVASATVLGSSLSVASATICSATLSVASLLTIANHASIGGSLSALELSVASKTITDSLSVNGASTFGLDCSVAGGATFGGEVSTGSNCIVGGDVSVGGTLRAGGCVLDGQCSVNGPLTATTLSIASATVFGAELTVRSATTLCDTLSVASATNLVGEVNMVSGLRIAGTLSIASNTRFGGELGVSLGTTLNKTLSVASTTTISHTLSVAESITCEGDISLGGSIVQASDVRLKHSIRDAPPQLAKLRGVKMREFQYRAAGKHQRKHIGVIAQELQVTPWADVLCQGDTLAIDSTQLLMRALKSIQELADRVDKLEKKYV